jgi:hypothetical protein
VVAEEQNFAEFAGEFACDDFWKHHEASLRVGGMVRRHWKEPAPSAVQTQAPNTKVSPWLEAAVGLK